MDLLVEVKVENSLPVNGSWTVPSLAATDLMPVVYWLDRINSPCIEDQQVLEWTEEDVFRATKNEDGIKVEFPMSADFGLLKFCVVCTLESMIRAVLDMAWMEEVMKRMKGSGLIVPQAQKPLRL